MTAQTARWVRTAVVLAVLGCKHPHRAELDRTSATRGEPGDASTRTGDDVCSPPVRPELTLAIERHVVPIGQPITNEAAEVTAAGSCTPDRECSHVSAAELERLAALVRAASPLRHREPSSSPHYGSRSITARWNGGSCTLGDSVQAPADETAAFFAAFDAIADAVVGARQ